MKRLLLTLTLLTTLTVSTAGAGELYVGAALGDTVDDGAFGRQFNDFGPRSDGTPAKLFAGYRLTSALAVEAAYYDLGGRTCCPQLADAGFDTELDAVGAALVGRIPLGASERLHLSARGGVLFWDESGDEITIAGPVPISVDGSDLLVGLGLSWQAVDNLGLGLEYEVLEVGEASLEVPWLVVKLTF